MILYIRNLFYIFEKKKIFTQKTIWPAQPKIDSHNEQMIHHRPKPQVLIFNLIE
jgi:hypothetical protein